MAVPVNTEQIKAWAKALGFLPQDGENGIYRKRYEAHGGYALSLDLIHGKIQYQDATAETGIQVWDRQTANLSQEESLVVLECVDRLLCKGYPPKRIELEKTYPSGRGHSGQVDVLVRDPNDSPFLIFECKSWGVRFAQERSKMLRNGGQLLSYYSCERAVRALCLYTSRLTEAGIEYRSEVIDVDPEWRPLSGVREIYDRWDKTFLPNGIFEAGAMPYLIRHPILTYDMLEVMEEEDGGKIYNQIMEILRHNAVSDKPNAFNKLLNLFLCKLVDEEKNMDAVMEFQWMDGSDTDETLQMRLSDLYRDGMHRFLDIDVIDYAEEDVRSKLDLASADPQAREWVMEMYRNMRRRSADFAFVEIQDQRTIQANAKVVREIVRLLQRYRFRYDQRHAFLGHFFELLLNTSMKQEAGQYFTPVPVTRFVLSSLPLQDLVQDRVDRKVSEPLPAVIDYACGSGHFLTEYLTRMQRIIGDIDLTKAARGVRGDFESWRGGATFRWAKDTVYGVDLDNRLVKTAKVSAFFNGDDSANIIWANGLDSFAHSTAYRGRLAHADGQDNGKFDILISNPPYSVDAFKGTLADGEASFTLYPYLTDSSSEIECLFVERMKQLLRPGGWAAVVLPSSILANSGIYARARTLLFSYFRVKAIAELGSNTFMKTGTNTVILFLVRRDNDEHQAIRYAVDRFFSTWTDAAAAGQERAFSAFVSTVYGLSLEDYRSIFSDAPTEAARAHALYRDDQAAFGDGFAERALSLEREKLFFFLLTFDQTVVLVKTGKGRQEKQFLGYEFSERRGHEGLHWLSSGTRLYSEQDVLDPTKASSYIYRAFLNDKIEVDESLRDNVSYARLSDLLEYGTASFDQVVNLNRRGRRWESAYPSVRLDEICDVRIGGTPSRDVAEYFMGDLPWVSVSELGGGVVTDTKERITEEAVRQSNVKLIPKGTTLLSFKLSIGKTAVAGRDLYTNEAIAALIPRDPSAVLDGYLFALFSSGLIDLEGLKGDNIFGKSLNSEHLKSLSIPLPPPKVQAAIAAAFESLTAELQATEAQIAETRREIQRRIEESFRGNPALTRLRQIAAYAPDRVDARTLDRDTYVGVDNLLPGVAGKRPSEYVPAAGRVTAYRPGDILLSNIRPYLKKAWLADNQGGSSGDVLVLRVDPQAALPEYVFYHLSADRFFDYEMENIGSNVKMPRADKRRVLDYRLPLPPLETQRAFAAELSQHESKLQTLRARLERLRGEKESRVRAWL